MPRRPLITSAAIPVLLGLAAIAAQRPSGPVLFSDEMGYLGAAVDLSTRSAAVSLPDIEFYSPGYGFLLAPFLSVTTADPWAVAVVVNLLFLALLGPALRRFLRTVTDVSDRTATTAATVAACTPSIVLQLPRAWPEVVLTVVVVLWATALARHLARREPAVGAALVALAALAFVLHRRAVVLLLVTAAALVFAQVRRRDGTVRSRVVLAVGGLVLLAGGFLVERAASGFVTDRLYDGARLLDSTERAAELAREPLLPRVLSQAWGSVHASLGLVVVGLVVLAGAVRRPDRRAWALALLATLGGSLLLSAVAVADGPRVDHAFYERYVAPVTIVAVALGVAALVDAGRRVPWWTVAAIPAGTVVLHVAVDADTFSGDVQKLTVPSLASIEQLLRATDVAFLPGLSPVLLTAAVTLGLAAVLAVARWRPRLVAGVLGAGFAVIVVGGSRLALAPFLDGWERFGADLATAIEDDGGAGRPVGVSTRLEPPIRSMLGYRLGYPELVPVEGGDACPDVRHVVVPPGRPPSWAGERLVTSEAPPASVHRTRC